MAFQEEARAVPNDPLPKLDDPLQNLDDPLPKLDDPLQNPWNRLIYSQKPLFLSARTGGGGRKFSGFGGGVIDEGGSSSMLSPDPDN